MISITYYPSKNTEKTAALKVKYFFRRVHNKGHLNIIVRNLLKHGGFVTVRDYKRYESYGLILDNGSLKRITINACAMLEKLFTVEVKPVAIVEVIHTSNNPGFAMVGYKKPSLWSRLKGWIKSKMN